MNNTQKSAWLNLFAVMVCIGILAYVGLRIFVFRSLPQSFIGRVWPALAFLAFVGLAVVLLRRRQSRAEPDSDERDNLIKRRAVTASFVSVWVLPATLTLVLGATLGQAGSVPVYRLTLLHFAVALGALLVYAVAILTQYSRGDRDEQ